MREENSRRGQDQRWRCFSWDFSANPSLSRGVSYWEGFNLRRSNQVSKCWWGLAKRRLMMEGLCTDVFANTVCADYFEKSRQIQPRRIGNKSTNPPLNNPGNNPIKSPHPFLQRPRIIGTITTRSAHVPIGLT